MIGCKIRVRIQCVWINTAELSTVSLGSQMFCFKINHKESFIGRLRIKQYTPYGESVSLHNTVCKQQRFLQQFSQMYAARAGYAFSFISKSVLGQVHSFFRIAFSKQWDLAQPSSISNILSFPYVHPIAAYVFFLVFPSVISFLLSPFNNAVFGNKNLKKIT
jgi:hypothetical protein